MDEGWRYRAWSLAGAVVIAACAVVIANTPSVQELFTTYTPLFWRLDPMYLAGTELAVAVSLNAVLVAAVLWPLYKPRPRRVLDTVFIAQKRVVVAVFALATLGYFNYSYRLPRTTLAITGGFLFVVLPLWFVWIRQRNGHGSDRAVVIGDDAAQIAELVETVDLPYVGYLCPARVERELAGKRTVFADGGVPMTRLGGLSRLEDVLVEYDVDTAVLAFAETDRGEFFGALDACYESGVKVKVHRDYVDQVLTDESDMGPLVDVDIEPWDFQDHLLKRSFDVMCAGIGLLVLAPIIIAIVLAIKLEDEGPVFFTQERTYLFGETFTVYKFRTLKPDPAGEVGTSFDGNRETTLGRFLRTTHLDEIPQLWLILTGKMSVVGPRPAQTALEEDFEDSAAQWRKRWFVKPGLTGLAQINDATSQSPEQKLQYDLQYIRNQSLTYDLKILLRQFGKVVSDVGSLASKE